MLIAARRLPPPPAHSSNPPQASPAGYAARGVWAPPRSLAATKGILSVPRGTEMFQFPRCPPRDRSQVPGRAPGGLPHSDIPGSPAASASPGHFAAWPRPSSAANAKASTMRPSCGFLRPSSLRDPSWPRQQTGARQRDASRLAAAPRPLPRLRTTPRGIDGVCFVSVSCVCCSCSARGRPDTSTPLPPLPVRAARLGSRQAPVRARRLPRPQNPAGSAWRIVKVPTTRRSSDSDVAAHAVLVRSSNLVRSRSPTSDEISQPAGGLVTAAGDAGTTTGVQRPGWSRGDSNPGPPPCKGGALPAKLRPPGPDPPLRPPPRVGAPGLEPGTSALSGPRSNHLSYAPAARRSPRRPQRRSAPGFSPECASRPMPKTERADRRSRTTQRASRCHAAHRDVAPPTSPAAVAPLPGASTVWRRETLGARCPRDAGSSPDGLTRSGRRSPRRVHSLERR